MRSRPAVAFAVAAAALAETVGVVDPARPPGVNIRGATGPAAGDDALIARVANGDQAAWTLLVHRHLAPLVSYAWYMLGDHGDAEDVAQETFVRLIAKTESWQPGGAKLGTWLHRVLINLCIDRRRARYRRPAQPLGDYDGIAEAASADGPERALDLARAVQIALARLPGKQRAALVLVHYRGFSNRETAEILETSVEAAESLLARARRGVREQLKPVANDLLGD